MPEDFYWGYTIPKKSVMSAFVDVPRPYKIGTDVNSEIMPCLVSLFK